MWNEWMSIEYKKLKMSRRRCRGRPCKQWIDQVKRDIQKKGKDWRMADEMQE
jgi:hypothetical protein